MSTSNTRQVAVSSIVLGTNFSRSVYDKTAMEGLKKSIMDFGLLQPIGVSPRLNEPGRYDLVYGYRRFIAYTELQKTEIPVTFASQNPLSEDARMKMNVAENTQRKDVTMMESGLRWRKLVESGAYTVKEIEHFEGVSENKIQDVLSLYRLIPDKFLKNIVANDIRADQSNLITQSKAHAIMTASKYEGIGSFLSDFFELIRQHNASEKEILEVRKLVQAGYKPVAALLQVRKVKGSVMTKSLRFKVRKRKWEAFREKYGHAMSEVVAKAIKKNDRVLLAEIADFIS